MTTAIVLAAGFSRRLGRPKQLEIIGDETLLHRAARLAREVAPTIVVIPAGAPLLRESVRDLDVTIVENVEAGEGIASSIRCGVRACAGDVLLTLCDQPRVTAAHLRALVASAAPIAASGYSGIAGVPAFFSAAFLGELLALQGDAGARRVIEAHRDIVRVLPFEEAAVDVDDDSPARKD